MNFDVGLTEIADGMARRNGGSPENALAFLKFLIEGGSRHRRVHRRRPEVRSHPVMHLQIVEVNAQLTGRYVASAPHSWTMRIGPAESRGAGWN
jgi:hypothetical protein